MSLTVTNSDHEERTNNDDRTISVLHKTVHRGICEVPELIPKEYRYVEPRTETGSDSSPVRL